MNHRRRSEWMDPDKSSFLYGPWSESINNLGYGRFIIDGFFFFGVVYDRKREVSRNKLDRSGITVSWLLYATMAHEAAVSGSDMESAGRQEWTRSMP